MALGTFRHLAPVMKANMSVARGARAERSFGRGAECGQGSFQGIAVFWPSRSRSNHNFA